MTFSTGRKVNGNSSSYTSDLESRLALILEATNEGMWDWDLTTNKVSFSPRWKQMLGYEDHELPNSFDEWHRRLHPDDRVRAQAAIEAYISGQTPTYDFEHRLRHKDGEYRWIRARGAVHRDAEGVPIRFIGTHTDITARRDTEDQLRENQRALTTLMSNLPGMAYRCRNDHNWPMEFVSEGAFALTGRTPDEIVTDPNGYGSLIHVEDRDMVWANVQAGLAGRESFQITYRLITATGEIKWVWEQGCGVWSPEDELVAIEGFVTDVTDRVNAYQKLEQRVDEQTRELQLLLEIANDVAGTLDLRTLAGLILDRIKAVVGYAGSAIFLVDDDDEHVTLLHYQGPIPQHQLTWRWRISDRAHANEVIRGGKPVIIDDVFGDHPLARSWLATNTPPEGGIWVEFGAWMGMPMRAGDRVIGMISVEIPQTGYYTPRHAELLRAVADQAAVAVENARLYGQARGLAALEERQKLARELHDSVSQALYGIGLGARTARTLLDRDPAKVADPLDYVISLAEAGLTEMRALIFELRPDALESEGLVGLLEKQTAALRTRYGLHVDTHFDPEPDTTLQVKEMLYRIAQEALHNTTKHARAERATLRLTVQTGGVTLEVADDGVGFDPSGNFPGHLGLRSMRERAARLGARFEVESAPGHGTRTTVHVPQTV